MENSHMFKALKIPYGTKGKTLDLKNRFMIPPMVSWVAKDGKVNDFHIARYCGFAMGGFGTICTGVNSIESDGRISKGDLGLWNDEQEKALKRLCDAIHADYYKGTKIGVQIGHAGRKSSSEVPWKGFGHIPKSKGGFISKSASPLKFHPSNQDVHELSKTEVKEMIKKFADSAERAKRAGCDFIELHGAHGYLIMQFLCQSTNKRTDEYGGSFENRTRFLMEIIEAVKERVGEFPIFVRISADEGPRRLKKGDGEDIKSYNKMIKEENEKRWTIKDSIELVKKMQKQGVCLVDVSSYSNHCDQDWSMVKPSFQVPFSHEIKKAMGDKIAVTCVGMIYDCEECERILKAGKADIVQLGRQALMNPYTPLHFARKMQFERKDYTNIFVEQHGYAIDRLYMRTPLYDQVKETKKN